MIFLMVRLWDTSFPLGTCSARRNNIRVWMSILQGEEMNTPDVLRSHSESSRRGKNRTPAFRQTIRISRARWVEKSCTSIRGVARVLAVARENLVPEIEKIAVALVLLGILLFDLFRFATHR